MPKVYATILLLAVCVSVPAQAPAEPGIRQRLHTLISRAPSESSRTNYQLELEVQRGGKSAKYKITLNGGSAITELIDRNVETPKGSAPLTISFSAALAPLDDRAVEVALSLGRHIPYKTAAPAQGANGGAEREVTHLKPIPLNTRVVLRPDEPLVIFEDEEEKLALRISILDRSAAAKEE